MPLVSLMVPKLRIPTAVLEILCGILVGRGGFHVVIPPDWIHAVTKIGLLYLMFLAGLEIRIPTIKTRNKANLSQAGLMSAAATLLVTLALSLASGYLLQTLSLASDAKVTAVILATTSLGVIIPVLKEHELLERPLGQVLLLSALLADFATVSLSSWVLHAPGQSDSDAWLQLGLFGVVGISLYIVGKLILRIVSQKDRTVRVSQLGVRGALAIMAICGGLATAMRAEVILGGFVAGFVCTMLAGEEHEVLRNKLEILGYSLFLPLFFITVGMTLDLSHVNFTAVFSQLPIYLMLAFLVKLGASIALRTVFSTRESIASGMLLSTRFTLVIAVAMLAQRMTLITSTEEGTLIAMALITVLVAPVAFAIIMP